MIRTLIFSYCLDKACDHVYFVSIIYITLLSNIYPSTYINLVQSIYALCVRVLSVLDRALVGYLNAIRAVSVLPAIKSATYLVRVHVVHLGEDHRQ